MKNTDSFEHLDSYSSLVLHYGEIALKRGNRSRFEQMLAENVAVKLGGTGFLKVRRLSGRIIVDYPQGTSLKDPILRVGGTFGVANVRPVVRVASCVEQIEAQALALLAGRKFASFAVRTKRGEKQFPLNSDEVNRRVGAAVVKASGAKVDLTKPELTLGIEILNKESFISCERFAGPGGLPIGSAGKVACLLSGGIDSPVAAFRLMKRGCVPFFVHFHSAPFTSQASVEKVLDMAEQLASGVNGVKIAVVPFGEVQKKLVSGAPEELRVLLYRRFMLRIAARLAKAEGAAALVTGDALAQVASQTLTNLAAIEAAVDMPVLRPLVGMDKQEIVDEAIKIGTYSTSCEPHDDCCSFLLPKHPATKSSAEKLSRAEAALDVEGLVELALQAVDTQTLSGEA